MHKNITDSYLLLQDAWDLSQSSVQTRHLVVGPLPAILALQLLQQVFHQPLQPEHNSQKL